MTEVITHGMSEAQNSVLAGAALHDHKQIQTSLTPRCCIQHEAKCAFHPQASIGSNQGNASCQGHKPSEN